MLYRTSIDNIFSKKIGLNIHQAYILDWIIQLHSWAERMIIEDKIYYFASRHKAVEELPLLTTKSDTIYRFYKQLEALELIHLKKINGKDFISITKKCSNWGRQDTYNSSQMPKPENPKFKEVKPEINTTPPALSPKIVIDDGKKSMKDSILEIYNLPYSELPDHIKCTPLNFVLWLEIIDKINKDYSVLWDAGRLFMPQEMLELIEAGFTKPNWDNILIDICGSGVKPEHNMYFRIKQFLQTRKNKNKNVQPESERKGIFTKYGIGES